MSDDLFSPLRQKPRAEFEQALKGKLDAIEEQELERAARPSLARRLRPAFASLAVLVILAVTLSLPAGRAAARSFLELFRVKRFAAVPVNAERLAKLQDRELGLKTLLSDQIQVIEEPAEPQTVADAAMAAELAGVAMSQPQRLPARCALAEIAVSGRGAFRATLDTGKLEQLAQLLEVNDLDIPPGVDGTSVTVTTAPVIVARYVRGKDAFVLFQSRAPEVDLPEGLDLAQLGVMALRFAGMSVEEARSFAHKIDWRTTVLVPVPAGGGDFREVEVGGGPALLVTGRHPTRTSDGRRAAGPRSSVLLWSRGNKVFALHGPGRGAEIIEMADSIR